MRHILYAITAFVLIVVCSNLVIWMTSTRDISAIVVLKEVVVYKVNDQYIHYYLIYTDQGVFKLNNDVTSNGVPCNEWYSSLKSYQRYNMTVHGYRNEMLGLYPKVINF